MDSATLCCSAISPGRVPVHSAFNTSVSIGERACVRAKASTDNCWQTWRLPSITSALVGVASSGDGIGTTARHTR